MANSSFVGRPLTVSELKDLKWESLSLEEKILVKKRGRPLPPVVLTGEYTSSGRQYRRRIAGLNSDGKNNGMYSKHSWLCGCEKTNRFFCFPCLLGRNLIDCWSVWNDKGAGGVSAIYTLVQKHEQKVKHRENVMMLAMLDPRLKFNSSLAPLLSNNHLTMLRMQKSEISRYWEKLNVIINHIRFCSALDMALRDSVEQDPLQNKLAMSQELELATRTEMEKSSMFQNKQRDVISDLLESMLEVYRKEVQEKIQLTTYLSFVVNELSELKSSDVALMYRFVDNNGLTVEHFWGFHKPINFSADCLAATLKQELAVIVGNKKQKLIGQRYDDVALLSGLVNEVQAEILKEYPRAHYVPCPCRDYDHAIQLACRPIQQANVFFVSLQSINNYFLHSPERTIVLATVTSKQVPNIPLIKWEKSFSNVRTVYKHQQVLYECCKKLASNVYSSATVEGAINIQRTLDDEEFCFWLEFFHKMMLHAEFMFRQLQLQYRGKESCNKVIQEFLNYVDGVKVDITNDQLKITSCEPKRRRMCADEQSVKSAAIEICDLIRKEISRRFQTTPYMELTALFANDRPELSFDVFKKNFPHEILEKALENYSNEVNKVKVNAELGVFYSCDKFEHANDSIPILKCLVTNQMENVFGELITLLKIVSTIPISSKERDPYFSKMTQIKNFLSNTVHENAMTALAVLAVERDFIAEIPDFNHKVIQQFASLKPWQMYFQYSNM